MKQNLSEEYSLLVKRVYKTFLLNYKSNLIRFNLFKINKYILWFCLNNSKFIINSEPLVESEFMNSNTNSEISSPKKLEEISSQARYLTEISSLKDSIYANSNQIYSLISLNSTTLDELYMSRENSNHYLHSSNFSKIRSKQLSAKSDVERVKLNVLDINSNQNSNFTGSLEEVIFIDFGSTTGDLINHKLYKSWKEKLKDFYLKPFDLDETYRSAMLRVHDFYKSAN